MRLLTSSAGPAGHISSVCDMRHSETADIRIITM